MTEKIYKVWATLDESHDTDVAGFPATSRKTVGGPTCLLTTNSKLEGKLILHSLIDYVAQTEEKSAPRKCDMKVMPPDLFPPRRTVSLTQDPPRTNDYGRPVEAMSDDPDFEDIIVCTVSSISGDMICIETASGKLHAVSLTYWTVKFTDI